MIRWLSCFFSPPSPRLRHFFFNFLFTHDRESGSSSRVSKLFSSPSYLSHIFPQSSPPFSLNKPLCLRWRTVNFISIKHHFLSFTNVVLTPTQYTFYTFLRLFPDILYFSMKWLPNSIDMTVLQWLLSCRYLYHIVLWFSFWRYLISYREDNLSCVRRLGPSVGTQDSQ